MHNYQGTKTQPTNPCPGLSPITIGQYSISELSLAPASTQAATHTPGFESPYQWTANVTAMVNPHLLNFVVPFFDLIPPSRFYLTRTGACFQVSEQDL